MVTLFNRYPMLLECQSDILKAHSEIVKTYKTGGKLLLCGNGGNCADCDHIVGELMKGFLLRRKPDKALYDNLSRHDFDDKDYIYNNLQGALPAISLPSHAAFMTAFVNDMEPDLIYAQLVYGYAKKEDMLICLSTSGNSKNVVYAAKVAKALGAKTLAITGEIGGVLNEICDITIKIPEEETYKIQELQLPVYHYLCAKTEEEFFEK